MSDTPCMTPDGRVWKRFEDAPPLDGQMIWSWKSPSATAATRFTAGNVESQGYWSPACDDDEYARESPYLQQQFNEKAPHLQQAA